MEIPEDSPFFRGVCKVCDFRIFCPFPLRWFANYPEFIDMAKHIFLTHRDLRGAIRSFAEDLKSMTRRKKFHLRVMLCDVSLEASAWRCCVYYYHVGSSTIADGKC